MTLSHLDFVKLQHLLADVHEGEVLSSGSDTPLSEFNPLTYHSASGDNCLHIAALRSNLEAIDLLVRGGIDINAHGDNGNTPLDYALNNKSGDVVSYLIAHGGVPRASCDQVRKWIKDKIE